MKRSLILLICLVLVSTLVFAGCRKKEAQAPAKDYSGITLTYYKVFDDGDIMEPLIRQFESKHPGLRINYKKFSDFNEYQRTILNEMAEGKGPDLLSMQNTWIFSNNNKLAPMPESLMSVDEFQKTFVDVAYKDLVRPDDSGVEKIYALPMTVDNLAIYYNRDHFEDRIPEQGRPSLTWEGIKGDVLLLNKEDSSMDSFEVSGIAMGRADNISRAVDILYLLMLQYGVDFYNENYSQAIFAGKQDNVLTYPGLRALELFTSFADPTQQHYSWSEYTVDDDSLEKEIEAFATGKTSMIVGFAYTYEEIMRQIDIFDSQGFRTVRKSAVRTAPIPQLEDPETSSNKRITYAAYFAETVSRNSKNQELAWEFLKFITSKENLDYYFDETNKPTSRRDMISEQRKDPIYGVFADQVGFAESFPILDYYTYKSIFEDVIRKANLNTANRSDLVSAQDSINKILPPEGLIDLKKIQNASTENAKRR